MMRQQLLGHAELQLAGNVYSSSGSVDDAMRYPVAVSTTKTVTDAVGKFALMMRLLSAIDKPSREMSLPATCCTCHAAGAGDGANTAGYQLSLEPKGLWSRV